VLVARLDIGLDVTINVFAGSVGEIAVWVSVCHKS
jgi:hypothetical protein